MLKACVCWQWSQHLHRQCLQQGKEPLLLNLDETSVPVVFTHGKGNIVANRGKHAWRTMPRQLQSRSNVRMFFTHVAIICDKPAIQPLLPQVIFVGAKSITQAEWIDVTSNLPRNVYVKRMPKGWNNTQQHRVILRILGLILRPFMATMQPILSFDAAPLHLVPDVLEEMTRAGIWYLVIPARLTWMLQPLDSHAFILSKNYLRRHFTDAAGDGDTRSFMRRMLDLVINAIRYVLQGHTWQNAFEKNGFAADADLISEFVRHQCGPEPLPPLPLACPSADQLRICWPRNRPFNEEVVMSGIPASGHPVAALMDAVPPVVAVCLYLLLPEDHTRYSYSHWAWTCPLHLHRMPLQPLSMSRHRLHWFPIPLPLPCLRMQTIGGLDADYSRRLASNCSSWNVRVIVSDGAIACCVRRCSIQILNCPSRLHKK